MSISSLVLVLELRQFLFIRDGPEIRKSEIPGIIGNKGFRVKMLSCFRVILELKIEVSIGVSNVS